MRLILNSSQIADVAAAIGSRFWWQKNMLMIIAVLLLIVSAFSVVVTKNQYRENFVNYQGMLYHQQQLDNEYAQLMLEKGAFSSQIRVLQLAQSKLHMHLPASAKVVMLTQ